MTSDDDIYDEDDDTIARLELALPRVRPPDDLFDRILERIRAEAAVVPLHRKPRAPRWAGPVGAAVLAAAAAVAITLGVTRGEGLGTAEARAAISGSTGVTGEADLYGDKGVVRVSLRRVPPAPSGHHYEVWVLRAGSEHMEAVGVFRPAATGDVELELTLPAPGPYEAVDVSVEDDGGSPAHSGTSLAAGAFE